MNVPSFRAPRQPSTLMSAEKPWAPTAMTLCSPVVGATHDSIAPLCWNVSACASGAAIANENAAAQNATLFLEHVAVSQLANS
jgi:hypothetical protein